MLVDARNEDFAELFPLGGPALLIVPEYVGRRLFRALGGGYSDGRPLRLRAFVRETPEKILAPECGVVFSEGDERFDTAIYVPVLF